GLISGTVGSTASTTTPYTPTITVTDSTNSAVETFTWSISPSGSLQVANPDSQSSAAGDEVALQIQAVDSSGNTVLYTASGLPAGLYLTPLTGLIFGTIDSGAASGSPYSVTVGASEGLSSASQTFSWTVNAAGTVTVTNPGDQTSSEGDSVSLAISA